MNDKIALYLVNGALGAGKTTLVDFLVQQPEFAGAVWLGADCAF